MHIKKKNSGTCVFCMTYLILLYYIGRQICTKPNRICLLLLLLFLFITIYLQHVEVGIYVTSVYYNLTYIIHFLRVCSTVSLQYLPQTYYYTKSSRTVFFLIMNIFVYRLKCRDKIIDHEFSESYRCVWNENARKDALRNVL